MKSKLLCILILTCILLASCSPLEKELSVKERWEALDFSACDEHPDDETHKVPCRARFRSVEDMERCVKSDFTDNEEFRSWAASNAIGSAHYYRRIPMEDVVAAADFFYNLPIPCLPSQVTNKDCFEILMSFENPDLVYITYESTDENIYYSFTYSLNGIEKDIEPEKFLREEKLGEYTVELYSDCHKHKTDPTTTVAEEQLRGYFSTDFCDVIVFIEDYDDPDAVSFDDFEFTTLKELRKKK